MDENYLLFLNRNTEALNNLINRLKIPEEIWNTPSNSMKTQNSSLYSEIHIYICGFSLRLRI